LSVKESFANGSPLGVSLTKLCNYYQERYYSIKAQISSKSIMFYLDGCSPFSVRPF